MLTFDKVVLCTLDELSCLPKPDPLKSYGIFSASVTNKVFTLPPKASKTDIQKILKNQLLAEISGEMPKTVYLHTKVEASAAYIESLTPTICKELAPSFTFGSFLLKTCRLQLLSKKNSQLFVIRLQDEDESFAFVFFGDGHEKFQRMITPRDRDEFEAELYDTTMQITREFREFSVFDILMVGFPDDAQFEECNNIVPRVVNDLQFDISEIDSTGWLRKQRQMFIKSILAVLSGLACFSLIVWFSVTAVIAGTLMTQNVLTKSAVHEKTKQLTAINDRFQQTQRYTERPSLAKFSSFLQKFYTISQRYPIELSNVSLNAQTLTLSGRFWSLSSTLLQAQLHDMQNSFMNEFGVLLAIEYNASDISTAGEWSSTTISFRGDVYEIFNRVAQISTEPREDYFADIRFYGNIEQQLWETQKEDPATENQFSRTTQTIFDRRSDQGSVIALREEPARMALSCRSNSYHRPSILSSQFYDAAEDHRLTTTSSRNNTEIAGSRSETLRYLFSALNAGLNVFSGVAEASENKMPEPLESRLFAEGNTGDGIISSTIAMGESQHRSVDSGNPETPSIQSEYSNRSLSADSVQYVNGSTNLRKSSALDVSASIEDIPSMPENVQKIAEQLRDASQLTPDQIENQPIVVETTTAAPQHRDKVLHNAFMYMEQQNQQLRDQLKAETSRKAASLRSSTSFNPEAYKLTKFYPSSVVLTEEANNVTYRFYLHDTYIFNEQLFELIEIVPNKKAIFYAEATEDKPASRIIFIPEEPASLAQIHFNTAPYRLLQVQEETATISFFDTELKQVHTLRINDSFEIGDQIYTLDAILSSTRVRFVAQSLISTMSSEIYYTTFKSVPDELLTDSVLQTVFNLEPYQLVKMYANSITLTNSNDDTSYEFHINDTFVFENRIYSLTEIVVDRKAVFTADKTNYASARQIVFIPEHKIQTLSAQFNVAPYQAMQITNKYVQLRDIQNGTLSRYEIDDYLVIDDHGYQLAELKAGKSAVFHSAETTNDSIETIVYIQRRAPLVPRKFFNVEPYHLTSITPSTVVLYDDDAQRHLYFHIGDYLVAYTRLYTLTEIIPKKAAIFYCPETESSPEHTLVYALEQGVNSYQKTPDEPIFSMSSEVDDLIGLEIESMTESSSSSLNTQTGHSNTNSTKSSSSSRNSVNAVRSATTLNSTTSSSGNTSVTVTNTNDDDSISGTTED